MWSPTTGRATLAATLPVDTNASYWTALWFVPPTWPSSAAEQQMMIHLDFEVDDLDEAVAHARAVGALLASNQPQELVRVMIDPAGHPFCLWVQG